MTILRIDFSVKCLHFARHFSLHVIHGEIVSQRGRSIDDVTFSAESILRAYFFSCVKIRDLNEPRIELFIVIDT